MAKVNSQPLKGFRDFLPEEERLRQKMIETIKTVFERYGFLPISTPVLEYKEALLGKYGSEAEKLVYNFKDRGDRELAMRYDFTVPLARFYAQYGKSNLPNPFKRYQIGLLWRADKPQRGRYREFMQCDADVVGTESLIADAEVIACFNTVLEELKIKNAVFRISDRRVLNGIMSASGVSEKNLNSAIIALDKLDKIEESGVRSELEKLGVEPKTIDRLFEFVSLSLKSPGDIREQLKDIPGADSLAELITLLDQLGVKNYKIDLSLARGLDYYTGMIMEVMLKDAPEFGSVGSGGRYDKLLGMFSGESVPAVGVSVGLDRLMAAAAELGVEGESVSQGILVCNLEPDLVETYLRVVRELREAGLKVDFYYEPVKLEKQLKFADKKKLKYAVIIGENEAAQGEATVKNLESGEQEVVKQQDLVEQLKK